MKNNFFSCLIFGFYLSAESKSFLTNPDHNEVRNGLFSGSFTMNREKENDEFKFSGTIDDNIGLSSVEGILDGNCIMFTKKYIEGFSKGQKVEYTLTQIESNASFVGFWKNGKLKGKATCSIVRIM